MRGSEKAKFELERVFGEYWHVLSTGGVKQRKEGEIVMRFGLFTKEI